ncbi:MAG: hypothetical protein DLM72_03440 [Candidatus Nitrosopolaris wilkensis]|nr:MAG: hypothetical protein DLM72_03440 [Candidatus Nitrosopolaris wilkensis]
MAFLRNAMNIFRSTKAIVVISIIVIIVISYGLFFYLQNTTESNIRNSLFEQQKQRQLDSTKAISDRISSDLDSIISRLQGLANSVYLQEGDLSSNKTKKLMKEAYLPLSTTFTTDRLLILNTNDISVDALSLKGEQIFAGVNFSYRDWVKQTKSTLMSVFSNGYEGRDGKYRIALTYPIVNRETGKYLGLVAALIPTIQFFPHYGNIYNINSQYLAVLDRQSVQLIHPLKTVVGTPFFGSYTQELTGHNTVLNNLIRKVMSGQPDFAVYDFINGQRLTTGYPIFEGGKPIYFVFVITPTATLYSQIDNVIFTERIEMFSLLAGVTAAIAVVILFLIRWSGALEREVKRRTKELDESNQRLEEANEQLKVQDKMQQEFINVAAHELRTPIQPILSATDILRSKNIDTNQRELIDVTIRNAKRLQRLSDNILDVTRIESGILKLSKERFDMIGEIQSVIGDAKTQNPEAKAKAIQITISTSDKSDVPIFVDADKVRIFQVISNLLSNAIKFTDKGGIVSISVEKRDTEAENKKKDVIVSIKDSGACISSEIIDRLFSKFATKSDTGTGLGLFISKSIIEAHGGRIWAKNNADGKGATFSFSLPLNN